MAYKIFQMRQNQLSKKTTGQRDANQKHGITPQRHRDRLDGSPVFLSIVDVFFFFYPQLKEHKT